MTALHEPLFRAALEAAAKHLEALLPENGAAGPEDDTDRIIDSANRSAARAIRALAPPADHVLVPKEPTHEMKQRGGLALSENTHQVFWEASADYCYRAMIKGE